MSDNDHEEKNEISIRKNLIAIKKLGESGKTSDSMDLFSDASHSRKFHCN